MDNGMIVYNRDVNAFAFKRSDEWINSLILCAMRAENVIDDFDAKDGIAGGNAGAQCLITYLRMCLNNILHLVRHFESV
jgi:hypothetical protein